MKPASQIFEIARGLVRSIRTIHDLLALIQLRPLLKAYIPMSSMAMNPSAISKICNDIIINKRKQIVEFGSGASTIYFAKIMASDAVLYSIDHDKAWLEIVSSWLETEGLRDRVVMIHAPLNKFSTPAYEGQWYDTTIVASHVPDHSIDCLVVDGPPAGSSGASAKSRYPALPFLKSRLSQSCSIYLDDAVREGEYEIANEWGAEIGVKFEFRLQTGGYAVGKRGNGYLD